VDRYITVRIKRIPKYNLKDSSSIKLDIKAPEIAPGMATIAVFKARS
jgi:hypothetical protein